MSSIYLEIYAPVAYCYFRFQAELWNFLNRCHPIWTWVWMLKSLPPLPSLPLTKWRYRLEFSKYLLDKSYMQSAVLENSRHQQPFAASTAQACCFPYIIYLNLFTAPWDACIVIITIIPRKTLRIKVRVPHVPGLLVQCSDSALTERHKLKWQVRLSLYNSALSSARHENWRRLCRRLL